MSADTDAARVRRAARSVGALVAVAAAVVAALMVAVVVFVSTRHSRHEGIGHATEEPPALGSGRGDEMAWVVDRDFVLMVVILAGVVSVVLMGVAAWLVARRAVAPLAEALRLQRNFVADASHELRTPLTVLNTRLQVLRRRVDHDQPIDDVVARLRQDVASMTDVLNDLLLSAEEEAGGGADVRTPVADVARAAASSVEVLAGETGVGLRVDVDEPCLVRVPQVTLTRAIVALVDNAIQHSPAGGEVQVTVGVDGTRAAIRVSDSGPGIRGIAPDQIFERFSHSSQGAGHRSFGLGLALVRDVAQRYGGRVEVERTSPSGTTLLLELPRA